MNLLATLVVAANIVLATISAPPLPKLYVYVENDPQTDSQHIIDALETPIEELYKRCPSPTTQKYLDWLKDERHTLFEAADLHILRRDQAGIKSYVDLPAWSFSGRDIPTTKFNPQVFCHWPAVPKHLAYLAKIYRDALQQDDRRSWVLGIDMAQAHRWFIVTRNAYQDTRTINGKPTPTLSVIDQLHLKYDPYPPIDLSEMPYIIRREYLINDGLLHIEGDETESFNCNPEYMHKILDEADFGTGIIVHPVKPKEKPEPDLMP